MRDSVIESTVYAWSYISTKPELAKHKALFQALADRSKRSIISDANLVLEEAGCTVRCKEGNVVEVNDQQYNNPRELARAVVSILRERSTESRYRAWKSLPMAGKVLRAQLARENSFLWLQRGRISATVARNIIAAQEGCLYTRASPCFKGDKNSCRKCGASWETPEHILTICNNWMTNLYIFRHDSIVRCIHYRYCREAEFTPPHYTQSLPTVLENSKFRLYCNMPIQTKAVVKHNKPDIVFFDLVRRKATIVEVAVSWFTRLEQQKALKLNRYSINGNHDEELKVPYPRGDNVVKDLSNQGWAVELFIIVVGACGEMSIGVFETLEKMGLSRREAEDTMERMGRSAALGSNRIIKQHLVSC